MGGIQTLPRNAVTANTIKEGKKEFGISDKIGYMSGDLGNCFTLSLANGFLMVYYMNVLGVSRAIIGTLFLISRILNVSADVMVGRLCDVSELTETDRFIPWAREMKYPFYLVTVILFLPFVQHLPMTAKIAYIFVSCIAYRILLSTINIPYGAVATAVSSNPNDRASLSTFRSIGSATGRSTTGFFIPILMYAHNKSGQQVVSGNHFFWISIGCAAIAFVTYMLTCKLTTEGVRVAKDEKVSTSQLIKGLLANRALIILVIVDISIVINQILAGTNIAYLFNDYFHNKQAMSTALLFTYGTVVVLAPFATKLAKLFSKKEASVFALFASSCVYLLMYFLHITNTWIYLILLFIATLGSDLFNLMVWTFTTDVIDYHRYKTDLREDGAVYGVNSFARKVGQAYVGVVGRFILALISCQSSTAGGAVQSVLVQERVYMVASLLPALCLFISTIILLVGYPLNRSKTVFIGEELKRIDER